MASAHMNPAMLVDFYEFTMSYGYFKTGYYRRRTVFDVFFRDIPDGGGFAVAAGLARVVEYVRDLHFEEEDIAYLRGKNLFDEDFLDYLRHFRFTGDIYAVPEGTPVFPGEPILTVCAPAIEAQLMETYLLLTLNHQSLIATKANRIVRAAAGRTVLEFGSRRAQGADGAIAGARAAYVGGCHGTACALTDMAYGVPAGGTMAHAWVQMFKTEYEAFRTYCEIFPTNAVLLVDTFNVLKSGVPNAIRAFKEVLLPRGITNFGIRLDSGDMAYLSKRARRMLDDETIDDTKPLTIFDQHETWKRKTLENFEVRELLVPIFKNGELVYDVPDIAATRAYCADCVAHLWEEVKRFDNPHTYYVDLSQKLYDIKQEMLASYARGEH